MDGEEAADDDEGAAALEAELGEALEEGGECGARHGERLFVEGERWLSDGPGAVDEIEGVWAEVGAIAAIVLDEER